MSLSLSRLSHQTAVAQGWRLSLATGKRQRWSRGHFPPFYVNHVLRHVPSTWNATVYENNQLQLTWVYFNLFSLIFLYLFLQYVIVKCSWLHCWNKLSGNCGSGSYYGLVRSHLENSRSSKSLKIAVGDGISLNFGAYFIQPRFSNAYEEQTQRPSGLLMLWKNLKKHRLKALFCTEWRLLENGIVSLKCPWIFSSKKGTNRVIMYHEKTIVKVYGSARRVGRHASCRFRRFPFPIKVMPIPILTRNYRF